MEEISKYEATVCAEFAKRLMESRHDGPILPCPVIYVGLEVTDEDLRGEYGVVLSRYRVVRTADLPPTMICELSDKRAGN
ncbi:MAG: hypothetical protein Q7O66_13815 [Dehalococcoidia bacterium]|nr:hypothetical protein [Dehalococcoidia bacterium]